MLSKLAVTSDSQDLLALDSSKQNEPPQRKRLRSVDSIGAMRERDESDERVSIRLFNDGHEYMHNGQPRSTAEDAENVAEVSLSAQVDVTRFFKP